VRSAAILVQSESLASENLRLAQEVHEITSRSNDLIQSTEATIEKTNRRLDDSVYFSKDLFGLSEKSMKMAFAINGMFALSLAEFTPLLFLALRWCWCEF